MKCPNCGNENVFLDGVDWYCEDCKKYIYATACILGGILYLLLEYLGVDRNINFIISGSFIAIVRIIAVKFNLSLPKFYK